MAGVNRPNVGRGRRPWSTPSLPGPPIRTNGPADLLALIVGYDPNVVVRREIPRAPIFNIVAVQKPIPPLEKYLNSLRKNKIVCDVNVTGANPMRCYDEDDKAGVPTRKSLLHCFACENCGQVQHRNMFACFRAGHLLCRPCCGDLQPTNKSIKFLGSCRYCDSKAWLRALSPLEWHMVEDVPLMCEFKDAGCLETLYESSYGTHVASCPVEMNAWTCMLCSKMIRADNMKGHFALEHPPLTYLVPRSPVIGGHLKQKLEFQIRVPFRFGFAVSRFHLDRLGTFVIYQLELDEYETVWFVVQSGIKSGEGCKLMVDIGLTATSMGGVGDDRAVYSYNWINRIYPWRTRLISSIKDVMRDDEWLIKTAKFNFKTLAETQGQRNFRCNLSFEVKEIVSGTDASFGLVDPQPLMEETKLPISALNNLHVN